MLKESVPAPPAGVLRVDEVMGPAVLVRQQTTLREVAGVMLAQHVHKLTAADVMERRVTSVSGNQPLGAAIQHMQERESDCAVVYNGSAVVGALGNHELLQKIAGESTTTRSVAPLSVDRQAVHLTKQGAHGPLVKWLVGLWR